ncbi:signal peptide, secreted protein [Cryptosporidium felis]|nr:signal peptide, secreted protein [Cryptosporidium felis]
MCSGTSEMSQYEVDAIIEQGDTSLSPQMQQLEVLSGDVQSGQLLLPETAGIYYIVTEETPTDTQHLQTSLVHQNFLRDGSGSIIISPEMISYPQPQVPISIPVPRITQGMQFGPGGKVQWLGGPVNFESMVDCKFYRQNPGFCVPMSIYTPCSRCKAGVRTIFRTSYKVRCPGPESFPPQLRPYFTWVPTSHRNPKRENKLFSRWRRQFMCIVMAISDVPSDLSAFWQHSQIYSESPAETPQAVPLLLGPYAEQQPTTGYLSMGQYQQIPNYPG